MRADSKLHHSEREVPRDVDCTVAEILEILSDAGIAPGDAFVSGNLAVIPRRQFPPDILDGDTPLLTDKDVPF